MSIPLNVERGFGPRIYLEQIEHLPKPYLNGLPNSGDAQLSC